MTDPIDIVERMRGNAAEWAPTSDHTLRAHNLLTDAAAEITRLRAALAAQVPRPAEFDHDIGADRYTVHRGAFWWHVRIGDSTADVGKFYTRNEAEDMALKLLTAFRDGAFARHRAAPGASPPPAALAVPDGWTVRDRSDLEAGAIDLTSPTTGRVVLLPAHRDAHSRTLYDLAAAMLAASQESATTRGRG